MQKTLTTKNGQSRDTITLLVFLTFICPVFCVPGVTSVSGLSIIVVSVSGLSIFDYPFGFSNLYLSCVLYYQCG
jgi:hypothetical protein